MSSKKLSKALVENLANYESEKRQRAKRRFFLGCLIIAVIILSLYIANLLDIWVAIVFIIVMAAVYFLASRKPKK